MKCIDSIVEFIFAKIFQTNSIPELQLTSDKLNENRDKSPSEKPIDITQSTIFASSPERIKADRSFDPMNSKTLKFDETFNTEVNKPIDITHSTIFASSPERIKRDRSFDPMNSKTLKFDETLNTKVNIKSDANDSIAARFIQDSKDTEEIFVRNPDNITDDESVYSDISSLIKNIRKHPDSGRKKGGKKTLKEIINRKQGQK